MPAVLERPRLKEEVPFWLNETVTFGGADGIVAGNNPLRFTDPKGKWPTGDVATDNELKRMVNYVGQMVPELERASQAYPWIGFISNANSLCEEYGVYEKVDQAYDFYRDRFGELVDAAVKTYEMNTDLTQPHEEMPWD